MVLFVTWVIFVVILGLLIKGKSPNKNTKVYNAVEVQERLNEDVRYSGGVNADPQSPFCVAYEKNTLKKDSLS